jgi:hypothetical protein
MKRPGKGIREKSSEKERRKRQKKGIEIGRRAREKKQNSDARDTLPFQRKC